MQTNQPTSTKTAPAAELAEPIVRQTGTLKQMFISHAGEPTGSILHEQALALDDRYLPFTAERLAEPWHPAEGRTSTAWGVLEQRAVIFDLDGDGLPCNIELIEHQTPDPGDEECGLVRVERGDSALVANLASFLEAGIKWANIGWAFSKDDMIRKATELGIAVKSQDAHGITMHVLAPEVAELLLKKTPEVNAPAPACVIIPIS